MIYTLPKLSYDYSALEPHIDALTMQIHHSKHHATYIDNLNKALEKAPQLSEKSLEELLLLGEKLPADVKVAILNNGGGHINHSFFWESMSPTPSKPSERLQKSIADGFGTWDEFQAQFAQAGLTRFGSGWAWLVCHNNSKELSIISTPNQENPLQTGHTPILGVDVWEHAYYLHYQNRRADYIAAWWNIVDWDRVENRLAEALTS
ncbi:MAG: Superoxide dismutase (Mn) [Microgenomates bacterium OLB22]|nr:MAG: Superoxide dismutase (Mn) [Microgenomates bacterium OLB22]